MITDKELGERLREVRKDLGFTQSEVAQEIEGLNRSALSDIERGEQQLKGTILQELSDLYDTPVDYFLNDGAGESENFVKAMRNTANSVKNNELDEIEDFCRSYQWLVKTFDEST